MLVVFGLRAVCEASITAFPTATAAAVAAMPPATIAAVAIFDLIDFDSGEAGCFASGFATRFVLADFRPPLFVFLEPIQEEVESDESDVILYRGLIR